MKEQVLEYFSELYYFDEEAAEAAVARLMEQPDDIKAYLKDADTVPMVLEWLGLAPSHAVGYYFARAVAAMM
jgi:hypothetical protein